VFWFKEDFNGFPDGGFVRIQTCTPHGPMRFDRVMEPIEVNPFADVINDAAESGGSDGGDSTETTEF